jgi:hypothetical protein
MSSAIAATEDAAARRYPRDRREEGLSGRALKPSPQAKA